MKILKLRIAVCVACLLFAGSLAAQSPAKIERELVAHQKNIEKWINESAENGRTVEDHIRLKARAVSEGKIFEKKILRYTKLPSTLKYAFGKLAEYVTISTSEDGTFRIYSWDSWQGGTMHFYKNVFQYRDNRGNVFSKTNALPEGDGGGFFSEVFTLKTSRGPVYLARSTSVLSSKLSYQSINCFKIVNTRLDDKILLIRTAEGMQNYLGIDYDFFSVVDREERPIKLILFDKLSRSIMVPVVVADKEFPDGRVTDRFDTYKFNGRYFAKAN